MSEVTRDRRYVQVSSLRERWGGVSHMFIERRIRTDPDFPPLYRMGAKGRTRLVDLDDLERYERQSVVRRDR